MQTLIKENWKWIPGYEGRYKVSSWGRIKSTTQWAYRKSSKGVILKQFKANYSCLSLMDKNGIKKRRFAHKLVLLAFLGPPLKGKIGRHLNGDPFDNRLDNLSYGNYHDNHDDSVLHGTAIKGSSQGLAKLTESDIPAIRKRCALGENQGDIAKDYGVSPSTINMVHLRKTWRHVL